MAVPLKCFSVITLKIEPFWINTYLVSDISEHWPSESKRWRGSSRLRSSRLKEDKNTNTVRRYKYKNSEWGPVRSNLTFRSLQLEWSSNKLSFWLPSAFTVWSVLNKCWGIFGSVKFVTEVFADFVNGLKENVTCGEDFATGENIIPDKHKVNMSLPLEGAIVQRVGYCKDH